MWTVLERFLTFLIWSSSDGLSDFPFLRWSCFPRELRRVIMNSTRMCLVASGTVTLVPTYVKHHSVACRYAPNIEIITSMLL
jgi:hypothetical protein